MNHFVPFSSQDNSSFSRALHMYYIMCVRCTVVTYWGLHHSQNNYDQIISAVTMAVFFTSSTIVNKHTNINNTDIVITSAGVGLQVQLSRDLPSSLTVVVSSKIQTFQLWLANTHGLWLVALLFIVFLYLITFLSCHRQPQCSVAKDLPWPWPLQPVYMVPILVLYDLLHACMVMSCCVLWFMHAQLDMSITCIRSTVNMLFEFQSNDFLLK